MSLTSRELGYVVLRLAMGMSMLLHGVNRVSHLSAFVGHTTQQFVESWLPSAAVTVFAYTVGPVELVIGLLVFFGLFTRFALLLGGLWMVALIFGSTVIEQYEIVGLQLNYSLIFAVLLYCLDDNRISVDGVFGRDSRSGRVGA